MRIRSKLTCFKRLWLNIFHGEMHFIYLILFIFLIGCSSTPLPPHTLRLSTSAEVTTLDPRKTPYTQASPIYTMLYEGLFRWGQSGLLEPALCEKWEISPDGKTYRFFLRKTRWSDGSSLTASDIEKSWKWMLDPLSEAPQAHHLFILKNGRLAKEGKASLSEVGVQAKDDLLLEVVLESPSPYFCELLTYYCFFPVKQNVFSGPFLATSRSPRLLILEKNPSYWEANRVNIPCIEIRWISDSLTELYLFQKGELDWAGAPLSPSLPLDAIDSLKKEGKLCTKEALTLYYYAFNTKQFPYHSAKLRRALALAIPKEEIAEHVTQGGERAAYAFFPLHKILKSTEDPDQLFEEALCELRLTTSSFPPLVISYNSQEQHHKIAQVIQEIWKCRFGIPVMLENKGWKCHQHDIQQGHFTLARQLWKGMTHDPASFLEIFSTPEHPQNGGKWSHPLFQRAFEKRDFFEADSILQKEMPVIPLFVMNYTYVKSARLKGEVVNDVGGVDFRWASIE